MTLRPILIHPDPRLKTVCKPVTDLTDDIRRLADDMLATMYDANGIGLAATQVDVHERVIVIDVSEARDTPLVLINPEVLWQSAETKLAEEGCLSVPGIYDGVPRAERVTVRALDDNGVSREIEADDLLAVCIQHEMDHLDGLLFLDRLVSRRNDLFRRKVYEKGKRKDK